MGKIKVFHFHNGSGGGVLSVIRNLLQYRQSDQIENHIIYTINRDKCEKYDVPKLEGASTEQIFYYSSKWNFYYTCRQLANLLPDESAVIVAHDWLELGMVSNLGLQNPVIHFVHGAYDYYYLLATKHSQWIDTYITVAQCISEDLALRLPQRKEVIHYLRFPVANFKSDISKKSFGFNIVFVGRCDAAKGYCLLPEIDKELIRCGIKVKWYIVGDGSEVKSNQDIWPLESDVFFQSKLDHNSLLQLLCRTHVLILPSIAEGMPITVIESMKVGVVPIVNNLRCGLQELIINGNNGFLVVDNCLIDYVTIISELYNSNQILLEMSSAAHNYVKDMFNPELKTKLIEGVILNLRSTKNKHSKKIYGSKLDHPFLPNILTMMLRKIAL